MATVDLDRLRGAYGSAQGRTFAALLDPVVASEIRVRGGCDYGEVMTALCRPSDISDALGALPDGTHVLVVSASEPFRSPPSSVLRDGKLGVLPFFSTGFTRGKLQSLVDLLNGTDFAWQGRESSRILDLVGDAAAIVFRTSSSEREAFLDLRMRSVKVFQQAGPIPDGGQSVLPGGEISFLTDPHGQFSPDHHHALNGRLSLAGHPIVHRGACPCAEVRAACVRPSSLPTSSVASATSQARLGRMFRRMRQICAEGIQVDVADGVIADIIGPYRSSPAAKDFEAILTEDSRYRKIHEIGIGMNASQSFFRRDNFMPNEMRRGVHLGLGLTPFTEFHIDIATQLEPLVDSNGTFVPLL